MLCGLYLSQTSATIYGDPALDEEAEARLIEQRLKQQQKQSEEDGKWLAEEETNLVST